MNIKKQFIKTLEERIDKIGIKNELRCPVCHNDRFTFIDGFHRKRLYKLSNVYSGRNAFIPCISLSCENCGNMLDFSAKVLDFLEDED